MLQKYKIFRASWLLLFLLITAPTIQAQSGSPQFNDLTIELWPEYDRSETLVIYRAQLNTTTALPTRLTFRLPGYIDSMHAVAYEQNGTLLAVDPQAIELNRQGDTLLLTFPAPANNLQLEYYDPQILSRQDQTRQIDFSFIAPYQIESATFQVQEPLQSENFSVTPAPSRNFTGNNGFNYNVVNVNGLAAGESFNLTATYNRTTDQPSARMLNNVTSEHAADITVETGTSTNENNLLGYVMVGGGVGLLLAVGGYWWWSSRPKNVTTRRPPKKSRAARRKKRQPASPDKPRATPPPPADTSPAGFCYQCGTALRPDSKFCHNCGAKRREEI